MGDRASADLLKSAVDLCGWIYLVFKQFNHRLRPLPKANPERVHELKEQARTEGIESLYEILQRVDANYARKMDGLNPQRIIRARMCIMNRASPSVLFTQHSAYMP